MSKSIRKMRFRMPKPVGLSKEEERVVEDGSDGRAGTIPEPKWIKQVSDHDPDSCSRVYD